MSIHRAKGLEFPIVIVPDLDRKAPSTSKAVVLHDRYGPIVRPESEPGDDDFGPGRSAEKPRGLGDLLHRSAEEAEERAEADRLFYVATTRAESHLILSNGLDSMLDRPEYGGESSNVKIYKPRSTIMQRLADRFNLADGSPTADIPPAWPRPRVGVVATSPERSTPGGPTRRRADRLAIVRAIRRACPEPLAEPATANPRPTWIDHDAEVGLSPFAGRVHRLVLAVLCDSDAAWSADPARAIELAAKATMPASPPRVVEASRAILTPWFGGELAGRIASARERRGGLGWTSTGEAEGPDGAGIVHRGVLDLAFREGRTWRIVIWEHPGAPSGFAERRLMLAARAAPDLGLGRVAAGWLVTLGAAPAGPREQSIDARRLSRTIAARSVPTPRPRPAARPSTGAGATRSEADDGPR